MNVNEAVDELEALGLDEDQATLYVQLLRAGPSKASTLVEATGYSRSKVYRTLGKMVEAGLAKASIDQPTIHTPVPPEELFDRLARRWQRGAERTAKARRQVGGLLETLHGTDPEPRPDASWRVVRGRNDILDILEELLRGAEKRIDAFSTVPVGELGSVRSLSLFDAIVDRADAGVEARLALHLDGGPPKWFEPLADHPRIAVRRLTDDADGHCVVIDDRVGLTWLTAGSRDGPDDDSVLQTDAPTYVETIAYLFSCLWHRAKPLAPPPVRAADAVAPPPGPPSAPTAPFAGLT